METTDTLAPVVAQAKTIEQRLAEEKAKDEILYREYCRLKEANEPTKRAMDKAGDAWCACRRRIEVLEEMKKELAR